MATAIVGGQTRWEGSRDAEGHRTYKLHVQTLGTQYDGPAVHMQTPGLPLPGSVWAYDNDVDVWAWCDGSAVLTPRQGAGQVNIVYDHVYTYSTKPRGRRGNKADDRGARKKCSDVTITNPLAEPPKRSGGTVRNTEQYEYDKDGTRLRTTSFEPLYGPAIEFDRSRDQVTVEFNDVNLNYAKYKVLVDTVNDRTLWGLPARCWKLTEWHWDWKLYGTCLFYVTHRFVFESNASVAPAATSRLGSGLTFVDKFSGNSYLVPAGTVYSRWDHYVPDLCTLCTFGTWDKTVPNAPVWVPAGGGAGPDYTKPANYDVIPTPRKGVTGNVSRVLSAANRGQPAQTELDEIIWRIQAYQETDFLSQIPFLPSTL